MRQPLVWIAVGLVALCGVVAIAGANDRHGETVSAADWAGGVCGAVGAWHGEIQAIVADVRNAPAKGVPSEEPQSETKYGGGSGLRVGLKSAVRATNTMVTAIDDVGTPDTPQGAQAAKDVSDWADATVSNLEQAQDTLEHKPTTIEQALEQLGGATGAIVTTLTSGVKTITDVARLDPQLAAAFRDSSTCQQLRNKEHSS
jgi:hypothetical protein